MKLIFLILTLNILANIALLIEIKNVLLVVLRLILKVRMVNKKYTPEKKLQYQFCSFNLLLDIYKLIIITIIIKQRTIQNQLGRFFLLNFLFF